jgi:hypothetical protein
MVPLLGPVLGSNVDTADLILSTGIEPVGIPVLHQPRSHPRDVTLSSLSVANASEDAPG